jgi:hypothetical protein
MAGIQKQKGPFLQADDWFTIAPSDTVNFVDDTTNNPSGYKIAAIFVGGAGNVSITSPSGTTKTFTGIAAGTFLPVVGVRVNLTNTTATLMLGLVSGVGAGV